MTNIIPKIDSNEIEPIQYKATIYRAKMPVSMTLDELLKPEAWINVKRKFPQIADGDLIQCVKEDNSLFIELFVIGGSNDILFVKTIRVVNLEEEKEERLNSPYQIKYIKGSKRHTVLRKSNDEELRSGFPSVAEAELWIRNNT